MAENNDHIDVEAEDLGFCSICGVIVPRQNIPLHQKFHTLIDNIIKELSKTSGLANILGHLALINQAEEEAKEGKEN